MRTDHPETQACLEYSTQNTKSCSSSDVEVCSESSSSGSDSEYSLPSENTQSKMKNPFSFAMMTSSASASNASSSSSFSSTCSNVTSSPTKRNEEREKLVNVNPVVQSLQKLQTLQSQNNPTTHLQERDQAKEQEELMIQRLLLEVKEMRDRVLAHLTSRSQKRIMNELKQQFSSMTEIPQLLGRCFNLSLNVKIIGQSFEHGYIDSTIGARILSDILILEQSLRLMLSSQQPEDLKRSKAMNNFLSLSGLKLDNKQDGRPKLGF
ncbi:hypothetical protein TCAL_14617 [Tigriopus californicus]|uniref:Uncharacterized protein n=1 Tax=Tigriopus californicus TaxID=6832 RepID=A0A553PBA8_TIGCA|nr:uncharacterized protein LOC131892722 isoform X2 [Tigriopus californicus]TRY74929.1 hypothetical protein TCAL_14617 [Tigriopus californicus]